MGEGEPRHRYQDRAASQKDSGWNLVVVSGGYAPNGNITAKMDVAGVASGAYTYDSTHPHAVASAFGYTHGYDGNGNLSSRAGAGQTWTVQYAGFDKPRWMTKAAGATVVGSEFLYNANRSRIMQLEYNAADGSGAPTHYVRKRTYGLGPALELNYDNTAPSGAPVWSLKKIRLYVAGPDGTIGAREFDPGLVAGGGTEQALVYHHDHLGSIESITPFGSTSGVLSTDVGGKNGRFSEDAWGQRRNAQTWSGGPAATDDDGKFDSLTPRGFTGHEMLDDLGFIHMNGRIYDPLLGRMLSADIVVQAPGNLQAYNRYSYVINNPVTYTDPTGFFWDPNSGFWGASEWGIFGKAAVVDPAVEGYMSGSLNMEKGMTEFANASESTTPGLDRTLAVLHIVAGVSEGVGIVADYAPGAKQVKGTANVLAKNVDEIAEGASKLSKMLAGKTDDAAGGAAKLEKKLDDVAVDTKKVEVDAQKPATHPLDSEAKPYPDVTGKEYKGDLKPEQIVQDHKDARALGGKDEAGNIAPESWETNARKAGFEGNLAKDRQDLIDRGFDPADVDKVLADEKKWIMNDIHPVPVDPEKLKKLQQQ